MVVEVVEVVEVAEVEVDVAVVDVVVLDEVVVPLGCNWQRTSPVDWLKLLGHEVSAGQHASEVPGNNSAVRISC